VEIRGPGKNYHMELKRTGIPDVVSGNFYCYIRIGGHETISKTILLSLIHIIDRHYLDIPYAFSAPGG
jgi:hypothetical protein